MRLRPLTALGIALCLVVAACGDDAPLESDASPDEVQAALTNGLLAEANADPNAIQLSRADAECIATGIIDQLGAERLAAVGYSTTAGDLPESLNAVLDEDERLVAARQLGDCIDLVVVIEMALVESGAPESRARCVAEQYVESGLLIESLAAAEYDAGLNARIDAFLAQSMLECR